MIRSLLIGIPLILLLPQFTTGQGVDVQGRVVDRQAGIVGIAQVSVVLQNTQHRVVTDSGGWFSLANVNPGDYTVELRRTGYVALDQRLQVPDSGVSDLEIALEPEPVELPLVGVRAMSNDERSRRAAGTASRVISFEAIQTAAQQGRGLGDVLRAAGFGLRVRDGDYLEGDNDQPQRILCIEAGGRGVATLQGRRRSPGGFPTCDMVPVFLDGLKLRDAGAYLRSVSMDGFDGIEWLNSIAAGTRFGALSENKGALLLYTRTGRQ